MSAGKTDEEMENDFDNALLDDNDNKKDIFDFDNSNLDFDKLEQQVLEDAKPPISKTNALTVPSYQNQDISLLKPEYIVKNVSTGPQKKPFSLAALLNKKNTIGPATSKPVDVETIEGKRDLIAQKDREAKNAAKRECIDKFAEIDVILQHIMVKFFLIF